MTFKAFIDNLRSGTPEADDSGIELAAKKPAAKKAAKKPAAKKPAAKKAKSKPEAAPKKASAKSILAKVRKDAEDAAKAAKDAKKVASDTKKKVTKATLQARRIETALKDVSINPYGSMTWEFPVQFKVVGQKKGEVPPVYGKIDTKGGGKTLVARVMRTTLDAKDAATIVNVMKTLGFVSGEEPDLSQPPASLGDVFGSSLILTANGKKFVDGHVRMRNALYDAYDAVYKAALTGKAVKTLSLPSDTKATVLKEVTKLLALIGKRDLTDGSNLLTNGTYPQRDNAIKWVHSWLTASPFGTVYVDSAKKQLGTTAAVVSAIAAAYKKRTTLAQKKARKATAISKDKPALQSVEIPEAKDAAKALSAVATSYATMLKASKVKPKKGVKVPKPMSDRVLRTKVTEVFKSAADTGVKAHDLAAAFVSAGSKTQTTIKRDQPRKFYIDTVVALIKGTGGVSAKIAPRAPAAKVLTQNPKLAAAFAPDNQFLVDTSKGTARKVPIRVIDLNLTQHTDFSGLRADVYYEKANGTLLSEDGSSTPNPDSRLLSLGEAVEDVDGEKIFTKYRLSMDGRMGYRAWDYYSNSAFQVGLRNIRSYPGDTNAASAVRMAAAAGLLNLRTDAEITGCLLKLEALDVAEDAMTDAFRSLSEEYANRAGEVSAKVEAALESVNSVARSVGCALGSSSSLLYVVAPGRVIRTANSVNSSDPAAVMMKGVKRFVDTCLVINNAPAIVKLDGPYTSLLGPLKTYGASVNDTPAQLQAVAAQAAKAKTDALRSFLVVFKELLDVMADEISKYKTSGHGQVWSQAVSLGVQDAINKSSILSNPLEDIDNRALARLRSSLTAVHAAFNAANAARAEEDASSMFGSERMPVFARTLFNNRGLWEKANNPSLLSAVAKAAVVFSPDSNLIAEGDGVFGGLVKYNAERSKDRGIFAAPAEPHETDVAISVAEWLRILEAAFNKAEGERDETVVETFYRGLMATGNAAASDEVSAILNAIAPPTSGDDGDGKKPEPAPEGDSPAPAEKRDLDADEVFSAREIESQLGEKLTDAVTPQQWGVITDRFQTALDLLGKDRGAATKALNAAADEVFSTSSDEEVSRARSAVDYLLKDGPMLQGQLADVKAGNAAAIILCLGYIKNTWEVATVEAYANLSKDGTAANALIRVLMRAANRNRLVSARNSPAATPPAAANPFVDTDRQEAQKAATSLAENINPTIDGNFVEDIANNIVMGQWLRKIHDYTGQHARGPLVTKENTDTLLSTIKALKTSGVEAAWVEGETDEALMADAFRGAYWFSEILEFMKTGSVQAKNTAGNDISREFIAILLKPGVASLDVDAMLAEIKTHNASVRDAPRGSVPRTGRLGRTLADLVAKARNGTGVDKVSPSGNNSWANEVRNAIVALGRSVLDINGRWAKIENLFVSLVDAEDSLEALAMSDEANEGEEDYDSIIAERDSLLKSLHSEVVNVGMFRKNDTALASAAANRLIEGSKLNDDMYKVSLPPEDVIAITVGYIMDGKLAPSDATYAKVSREELDAMKSVLSEA